MRSDGGPVPSIEQLVIRAREVGALARACAQQTEVDRRVANHVVAQAREAGLFRAMQPRAYGGYEYGFEALIPIVAAVGAGCGSSGWVVSLGIVHQWMMAMFPKAAQDEVWSNPDALVFGSYPPVGKVQPAPGGFRVSGTWDFTSGCDHAQWLLVGGMANIEGDTQPLAPTFFLVPKADLTVETNWHTMGLAGTGSHAVKGEDIFVPTRRVARFADLLAGTPPGASVHANAFYRMSLLSSLPFALVAPMLGMAEGALADFVDMAKVRATRGAVSGGSNRMAEFSSVQSKVAEATGCINAARLTMLDCTAKALAAAGAGIQADRDLRQRCRLGQAFSAKLLLQAVDVLFQASGGMSIFMEKPIQRAWRDMHAASVHVSLNWDAVSSMYGQHVLGLEPRGQH